MYVYVAGPITTGHIPTNINKAIQTATRIRLRGHIPFVPHLFELWDLIGPQDYEFWMKMDFKWLEKCDLVVRLPGESKGADRETAYALQIGIPVFWGLEEFMNSIYWTRTEE